MAYNIDLTLRVKQGDELLATKQTSLRIVDSVIFDDPELDTDGDGIPDIEEGVGDSDKDGIADYFRDLNGTRPSVDLDYPDIIFSLFIFIACTFSFRSLISLFKD